MDGFIAFPVGAGSTSFAEDGYEGSDVPGRHKGVDSNFGTSGCDEEMSAAVAPAAGDANAIHDIDDGIKAAGFSPVGGFREHEPGVVKGGILRSEGLLRWSVGDLPPAAGAIGGVDDFVEGGQSANAGGHAVLEFDTNQGTEEWYAVNEGFCAVDGVNDPAEAAGSGQAREFLPKDGILGEVGLNVLSDE